MTTRSEVLARWAPWLLVITFAAAMAYVEAAVVLYLRTLTNRLDPYQPAPLVSTFDFAGPEIIRELATMVMLSTVGLLAGRTLRARFGFFLLAFGVWDICYYLFLSILAGWPRSLLDWDVLFLIPLPWWGPVLAPVCLAGLMILYGTFFSQFERPAGSGGSNRKVWLCFGLGVALALFVFMADAIRVAGQGEAALRNLLPVHFNWWLFAVAVALLGAPLPALIRRVWPRPAADRSAQTD